MSVMTFLSFFSFGAAGHHGSKAACPVFRLSGLSKFSRSRGRKPSARFDDIPSLHQRFGAKKPAGSAVPLAGQPLKSAPRRLKRRLTIPDGEVLSDDGNASSVTVSIIRS